jgi:hypothetical protein
VKRDPLLEQPDRPANSSRKPHEFEAAGVGSPIERNIKGMSDRRPQPPSKTWKAGPNGIAINGCAQGAAAIAEII